MRRARAAAFSLSEQLALSAGPYEPCVVEMLNRVFPEVEVRSVDVDPSAHTAAASRRGKRDMITSARLLAVVDDHPMIRSYLPLSADNLAPRRMSDLLSQRELVKTRTYCELLRPTGTTHQLTIMTSVQGTRGTGWVINRSGTDFLDIELEIALALQPALAIARSLHGLPARAEVRIAATRHAPGLTDREVEVLSLIAEGLTAVHVGHVLRISASTVRKHLEHAYGKLNAHDRLVAVAQARAAGLIP